MTDIGGVTDANFDSVTSGVRLTVILWSAPWCRVCPQAHSTLQGVADQNATPNYRYADMVTCAVSAEKLGITSVPAFTAHRNGQIVAMKVGSQTRSAIHQMIESVA